mmetsp:Transcript_66461/g.148379  ORF Transcript_66461/g.148379 Transcript_66461/m.148379 type:complete len:229 (+) Transcript_66461:238-924(+)
MMSTAPLSAAACAASPMIRSTSTTLTAIPTAPRASPGQSRAAASATRMCPRLRFSTWPRCAASSSATPAVSANAWSLCPSSSAPRRCVAVRTASVVATIIAAVAAQLRATQSFSRCSPRSQRMRQLLCRLPRMPCWRRSVGPRRVAPRWSAEEKTAKITQIGWQRERIVVLTCSRGGSAQRPPVPHSTCAVVSVGVCSMPRMPAESGALPCRALPFRMCQTTMAKNSG